MDDRQRKAQLKKTFDTVAEGYGSRGMEFFHNAAAHLPRVLKLQGHEHLLDVATGTGIAATAIAPHLPHGKVTGIDLSEGMLAQARARAQSLGLASIEFHAMDMQDIGFDNARSLVARDLVCRLSRPGRATERNPTCAVQAGTPCRDQRPANRAGHSAQRRGIVRQRRVA